MQCKKRLHGGFVCLFGFFRGRWVYVEIQRRALLMSAAVFAGRYARFLAECAVERADTLKAAAEGNLLHSLVCERQSAHGGGYAQAFQVGVEAHANLVVANAGELELRQPQMLRCLRERDGVVEILVQVFQHLCFLGHGELLRRNGRARIEQQAEQHQQPPGMHQPVRFALFRHQHVVNNFGDDFGTDNLGRDIFARVLYGAQISMTVGFTVGLLSALIGTALGLYASVNKVLDNVLMRLCDGLKAIPNILLAITLMAVLGANMKNVIISLTIVSIPGVARIARSQALLAREQTYAEAMTAVGASRTRILWRHILPNILSPIIVQMTFTFATAIISEASLSFLGAGIPSPYPSWGGMLNEARGYVYMGWWMIVFPAIFTALSVLGFNLFGDGLRDLIDPLSGR